MPSPPFASPEFEWSAQARIANQLLLNVRENQELAAFFTEITAVEIEDLFLEGTWSPPFLLQMIPGWSRTPNGSNRQGKLEVEVEWLFAWPDSQPERGTSDRLRERVLEHFCRHLEANFGVVTEAGSGAQLTLGLLGIRKVPAPVRLTVAQNVMATRVLTVHKSCIHLETGEIL